MNTQKTKLYTYQPAYPRFIVHYSGDGKKQPVALFEDGHFAERHANILNEWADNMGTLGYITKPSGDEFAIQKVIDDPYHGLSTIPHATFKSLEDAEKYAIQKNTDLMFDAYEAENRTWRH